jgi:hypothetical protein
MVFRLLQPRAMRIELKVHVHRHKRERGMRQCEFWIARDGAG